jgi:hypothetical protein
MGNDMRRTGVDSAFNDIEIPPEPVRWILECLRVKEDYHMIKTVRRRLAWHVD